MGYARKKFKGLFEDATFQDIWRNKSRLVSGKEFENGI